MPQSELGAGAHAPPGRCTGLSTFPARAAWETSLNIQAHHWLLWQYNFHRNILAFQTICFWPVLCKSNHIQSSLLVRRFKQPLSSFSHWLLCLLPSISQQLPHIHLKQYFWQYFYPIFTARHPWSASSCLVDKGSWLVQSHEAQISKLPLILDYGPWQREPS